MKQLVFICVAVPVLLCAGCSSTKVERHVTELPPPPPPTHDTTTVQVPDSPPRLPAPLTPARTWKPSFVATGLSSGIMIEFKGLKPGAPLRAKTSSIELWPYPVDTVALAARDSTKRPPRQSLSTTINSLRQAFFKVPPGMYLVRHSKEWADTSYIRNVEVRDGEYSVVSVTVFKPKPALSPPVKQ